MNIPQPVMHGNLDLHYNYNAMQYVLCGLLIYLFFIVKSKEPGRGHSLHEDVR